MFIWKKEFETGFIEMDGSNRLIVFEINEFSERILSEPKNEYIMANFDQLIRILSIKFNIETLFYRDNKFLEVEIIKHAKAHNQILFLMEKARMDFAKKSIISLKPVIKYLELWLMQHIVTLDREILTTEQFYQVNRSAVFS